MDWSVMLSLAEFFKGTPLQTAVYASMAALFFLLSARRALFLIRPLARLLESVVMQVQESVRELLSLPADVARRLASIEPYFAIVSSVAMMVAGVSIGGIAVLALRTSGETVSEMTQLLALGTLPFSALYCRISFCELCRAVGRVRY